MPCTLDRVAARVSLIFSQRAVLDANPRESGRNAPPWDDPPGRPFRGCESNFRCATGVASAIRHLFA